MTKFLPAVGRQISNQMPNLILRQAQDDGLEMLKFKIMVRPRRELSRTLVEPLILDFDIHLTFGFCNLDLANSGCLHHDAADNVCCIITSICSITEVSVDLPHF